MTAQGTVYLLHFRSPYRHARHYLGYCAGDVAIRVAAHQAGQGARLLAVVSAAGIGVDLVRTWPGDRSVERRLKRRHNSPRMCPVCRSAALARNTKEAASA
jgi:hypothetical protein